MARGRFGIRTSGGSNSRASFGDCGPQWALAAVPRLHLHNACGGCSAGASLASGPSWTSRNLDLWRSELLAPFGRPFLFVTEHFLFLSQVVKKGSVEKGGSWSLRFFRDVISTLFSGLGSQWSTRIEDLGQDLVDSVAKVVGGFRS